VSVSGAHEQFCHLHDPDRSEERQRAARRAGKAKPSSREIRGLKEEIKTVIADVKAGDLDRSDAAIMIQGYRALKDFIALERQIKETDELEARIEALEQPQEGGRQWGV
jgi:hypothetical protein